MYKYTRKTASEWLIRGDILTCLKAEKRKYSAGQSEHSQSQQGEKPEPLNQKYLVVHNVQTTIRKVTLITTHYYIYNTNKNK